MPSPTISGTAAAQAVTDRGHLNPFADVVLSEDDPGQNVTAAVALSSLGDGTLSNLGIGALSADGLRYVVSGSLSDVQAALQALAFTPSFNLASPGATVLTGLGLTLSDGTSSTTDLTTSVLTTEVADPSLGRVATLFSTEYSSDGTELWITDGTQAGTSMLADIYPGGGSSDPSQFTAVGNRVVFTANDGSHGSELWVTGGTATSTSLLADINPATPGPGVFSGSYPSHLTPLGGKVLFFAGSLLPSYYTDDSQLWTTDGTAAGTSMVADLAAMFGSGPTDRGVTKPPVVLGDKLLFGVEVGGNYELAASDGTSGGTGLLYGFAGTGSPDLKYLTVFGDHALFYADPGGTSGLWITDGTAAGTSQVTALAGSPAGSIEYLVAFGDRALFTAGGADGRELWVTDGTTAGTSELVDIYPGPTGSYPQKLTVLGNHVLFAAGDGVHGTELWVTDGTAAGTSLLADINPGTTSSYPNNFAVVGDKVFFEAENAVSGGELWVSDGTAAGTSMLVDINPGSNGSYPSSFTVQGGEVLFSAGNGVDGGELWITDGTAAGTSEVKNIYPGPSGSYPQNLVNVDNLPTAPTIAGTAALQPVTDTTSLLPFANVVLTEAEPVPEVTATVTLAALGNGTWSDLGIGAISADGLNYVATGTVADVQAALRALTFTPTFNLASPGATVLTGMALSLSDGTFTVTDLTTSVLSTEVADPGIGRVATLFGAVDTGFSNNLWITDGTAAGTSLLKAFDRGFGASGIYGITPFGHQVLFATSDTSHGAELWVTGGTAATTSVLADINPGPGDSFPSYMTQLGSEVVFFAETPAAGTELWATDGTTAGTSMVLDINPGPSGINPRSAVVLNGHLLFGANVATYGQYQLWSTDGTAIGTSMVAAVGSPGASRLDSLTAFGTHAVFTADDGASGDELWITDGTAGGTSMLKDIDPGASGSRPQDELTVFGNDVVFSATDGVHGYQLWITDGTSAGTSMLSDIAAPSPYGGPDNLAVLGDRLLFSAEDSVNGSELWVTDGTAAGTSMLIDLNPGSASSYPQTFTVQGGKALFSAYTAGQGYELFVTDGTAAGTGLVKDLIPGKYSSYPSDFVTVDNLLAPPTISGTVALQPLTDVSGRAPFAAVVLGEADPGHAITAIVTLSSAANGHLSSLGIGTLSADGITYTATGSLAAVQAALRGLEFDVAFNAVAPGGKLLTGLSLTVSDGTLDATDRTTTLLATAVAEPSLQPAKTLFSADDGTNGRELWITDGSAAGTSLLMDINPGAGGSDPSGFASLGGHVLFAADNGSDGRELWSTGGTAASTVLLADINTAPGGGSSPTDITVLGSQALFAASDGPDGAELWTTDGTAAGTSMLADINAGAGGSNPANLTVLGNSALFTAYQPSTGTELWITDGTGAGTSLLLDIDPGTASSGIAGLTVVGDRVIFSADDGASGAELWTTDGTVGGTSLLMDIQSGSGSSNPQGFTLLNGKALFTAEDAAHGEEVWVTDGTAAGTSILRNLVAGPIPGLSPDTPFTVLGNHALFNATDPFLGMELWTTDGTAEGTSLLKNIAPSSASSMAEHLTVLGDKVLFTATDGTGYRLWSTDGTPAGTVAVTGIYTAGSMPGVYANPIAQGAQVLFAGADTAANQELWTTDGTAAGTSQLADIAPGSGVGSAPADFFTTDTMACFLAGTRIAVPGGECPVEDLAIGDLVLAHDGRAVPVKWLGRRGYPASAVMADPALRPVRIPAGALGGLLPRHDLFVSPQHALFIDGVLVPAGALVGAGRISRRNADQPALYIHIELAAHDLVLAEGSACETFVDQDSRAMFANADEFAALYPHDTPCAPMPIPRIEQGMELAAIRAGLAAGPGGGGRGPLQGHIERVLRTADGWRLEGWAHDPESAAPVCFELMAGGVVRGQILANRYRADLDRAGLAGGRCGFAVMVQDPAVVLRRAA